MLKTLYLDHNTKRDAPFKLRIHLSSRFFNRLSSRSDKSSGIDDKAKRAIKKSIGMP